MPSKLRPIIFLVPSQEKERLEEIAKQLSLSLSELAKRSVRAGLPVIRAVQYPGIQPTNDK